MSNLYTHDLSTVTAEAVAQFLCLDLPDPKARPREGARFDFKLDLPQDLGDTVAALSNTYGGLVILGVASVPGQKNVPGSLPGTSLGRDPKARITDKLLATVHPRPDFEVHVTPADATDKQIAVIRVREGPFPPYEFSQGGTIRIPVRVEDSDRQASVREIEELFRRREARAKLPEDTVQLYLLPLVASLSIPGPQRSEVRVADVNRFAMTLVPTGRLAFQLDQNMERRLESIIHSTFSGDREFSRAQHGAQWRGYWHQLGAQSDFEFQINEGAPCDRIWRFWPDGKLGFVTNHSRVKVPESVGNLVSDALRFFRMATKLYEEGGYYGGVVFAQNLQCPSRKFEASFPALCGIGGYDEVPGIRFPDVILRPRGSGSTYVQQIDWDSALYPIDVVTWAMVYHLREIASASVDAGRLRQHVDSLWEWLESSVWANP
jgi:hypothetical protein